MAIVGKARQWPVELCSRRGVAVTGAASCVEHLDRSCICLLQFPYHLQFVDC